jgi:trypsin-like peptidase
VNEVNARTEKATVQFLQRNRKGGYKPVGQGVLVPGDLILTAAHCIDWDALGGMVLGNRYVERIEASNGATYMVSPIAIETVCDIAALGAADGQVSAFEEFCKMTEPVPLLADDFKMETPVPVHVLTHTGTWVTGRTCRYDSHLDGSIPVEFDAPITGGTLGGPVINDNGLLVGVISSAKVGGQSTDGSISRPHLALPVWVVKRATEKRELIDL